MPAPKALLDSILINVENNQAVEIIVKGISQMVDALEQNAHTWDTCEHEFIGISDLCRHCWGSKSVINAIEYYNTGKVSQ